MQFLQQGSTRGVTCVCVYVTLHARERGHFAFFQHLHAAPCKRDIYLKRPEPAVHSLGRLYRSAAPAVLLLGKKHNMENSALERTHITYPAAAAVSAVKCVMAAERMSKKRQLFRPAARAHIKFADREIKWEAFSGRQ